MTRILFLDDDEERISMFLNEQLDLQPGSEIDVARSAGEAIRLLETNMYDQVDLDHDLDGKTYVDMNDPNCGMEVVRWMVEHCPQVPEVVIHSWNYQAAQQMESTLKAHGYNAVCTPFDYGDW